MHSGVDNLTPLEGHDEGLQSWNPRYKDVDPSVVEALRKGDQDAFDMIYKSYFGTLRDFLKVLIRNSEDAKEIAQDVFAGLWEKRTTLDPSKNIRSYIYTIARAQAFNYFNHKKVQDKYARYFTNGGGDDEADSADQVIIAEETRLLIDLALSRMPEKRRQVFELRRNENLSYDEIAEMLSISKNTVKNHIIAATRDIREVLALFVVIMLP